MHSRTKTYLAASAISGVVWALVAVILDGATEADSSWAIPWQDPLALVLVLLGGVIVGVLVGTLIRKRLQTSRRSAFLPFLTLPLAITLFAVFVWASRVALGYHFLPPLSWGAELGLILETYLFYGLLSLATPLLYALALLNQRALRVTA